jgi:hypothetical protein
LIASIDGYAYLPPAAKPAEAAAAQPVEVAPAADATDATAAPPANESEVTDAVAN